MAFLHLMMETHMKEISKMIILKEKENIHIQMEIFMKVNLLMMLLMGKEFFIIQMTEKNMMENGKMI